MFIEIPLFIIVMFTCIFTLALIGIMCVVIDTYINTKEYKHWCTDIAKEELEKKVGEIVDDKINPGGGDLN